MLRKHDDKANEKSSRDGNPVLNDTLDYMYKGTSSVLNPSWTSCAVLLNYHSWNDMETKL